MVPNPREGSEYSCAAARNAPVAICHVILRKPLKCLGTKLHLVSFTNPTKWLSSYDSTPSGVTVACVYFLVSFQNWPLKAPLVGEKKTSLYYYYYWMLHTVSEYLDVIYETCLVKLISLGSDSLTKICMYKKTCVWRVRGDWTCRRRCKYKVMVEKEPTARLYISLLTHLSASLSCLQSTDNKPYASCCRSFWETLLPPPTTIRRLAVLCLLSTRLTDLLDTPPTLWFQLSSLSEEPVYCEGVGVKWEVRNGRVSATTTTTTMTPPCQGHLQPS